MIDNVEDFKTGYDLGCADTKASIIKLLDDDLEEIKKYLDECPQNNRKIKNDLTSKYVALYDFKKALLVSI